MSPSLTLFFTGMITLFAYFILHALIFRYFRPERRWYVTKILFLTFLPIVLVIGGFVIKDTVLWGSFQSWRNSFFDLSLIFIIMMLIHVGYLTFYGFIDRSITLRAFIEIQDAKDRSLTFSDLVECYDTRSAYLRRLEILQQNNYLTQNQGRYYLTDKGIRVGLLVQFLKSFYRLGPGG